MSYSAKIRALRSYSSAPSAFGGTSLVLASCLLLQACPGDGDDDASSSPTEAVTPTLEAVDLSPTPPSTVPDTPQLETPAPATPAVTPPPETPSPATPAVTPPPETPPPVTPALNPTPEPTPEDPGPTPTPEPPETAVYRFTAQLDVDADGNPATALNGVGADEQVYFFGDFNDWDPQDEAFVMTRNSDGSYSIEIEFPLASEAGGGSTIHVGDSFKYKVAKTATSPLDPASNEVVDYKSLEQQACGSLPGEYAMPGALYEVGAFLTRIKEGENQLRFNVEAWQATAEAYGYQLCQ